MKSMSYVEGAFLSFGVRASNLCTADDRLAGSTVSGTTDEQGMDGK